MDTAHRTLFHGFRLMEPWHHVGKRILARAEKDSRAFYITPDGRRAFNYCFEFVGHFVQVSERLFIARAKENGRWRHINEKGHRIYQRKTFAYAGDFREVMPGLFLARVQGCRAIWHRDIKAYHIRPTGQPQYQERYDQVGTFEQHGTLTLAIARLGYKKFYINTDGKIVRPF
jgi:hypothetical protein